MGYRIRLVLIVSAILVFIFMIRFIRRSKLVISEAVYWFLFATLILVLAVVPEIAFYFSRLLGIASASNLVFLVIILLLIIRVFQQDISLSALNTKYKTLIQELAINEHDSGKKE